MVVAVAPLEGRCDVRRKPALPFTNTRDAYENAALRDTTMPISALEGYIEHPTRAPIWATLF